MTDSFLSRNLDSLKKVDIALFNKIVSLKGSTEYVVTRSKSGPPTLSYMDSRGKKKKIHSNYDPVLEATRYLKTLNIEESLNFLVIGLGLGYQVFEIIKSATSQTKIYIFEKDPELFALALREVDFSIILEHPGVRLFVDTDPRFLDGLLESEQTNFALNNYCVVKQKSLVDENLNYFDVLLEEIEKYFNEAKINLKTQSIHSKLYYKNIFSNLNDFLQSPGIKSLRNCLPDIPAIVCSAGPSLDKNIQLLKTARKRFFLISVGTALKPLLYNGIKPDVVVSIDPDEQTINSFDFINDTDDFWLLYNSAVPNAIPKEFPKRRLAFDLEVYLAEWFRKYTDKKGDLGKISSVAHSAVKFAQYLGNSPVILVGQDLSFFNQRQHCLHSFYHEEHLDKVSSLNPLSYWNQIKYSNFGPNLTKNVDLFGEITTSTKAMESYNHLFSKILDDSHLLINATEGGMSIIGTQNLSLRETIYTHCKKLIHAELKPDESEQENEEKPYNSLRDPILMQIQFLQNISEELEIIRTNYLIPNTQDSKNRQPFIDEMEKINAKILKNKETVFLLQGYDFEGFSNWYRSNSQIQRKKELSKGINLSDEEFKRDREYFEALVESVAYLITNFKNSTSH